MTDPKPSLMLNTHREIPSIAELRALIHGHVIAPGDEEYDAARTVFYGGIDRRPAAIVRAADAGDVSRLVNLARETGVELAVRGGGHSFAGHGVSEGGLVLDLAALKSFEYHPKTGTAWAGAGLTAGEYTHAAAAHGMATGFGDTGSVGIGGLTLGGGVGYLVRKYGLTIDDLLAAEVVTADGRLLRADAESHPDLFWALRGGGGNFGVVTRFKFRLHPVDTVFGGMLILPATPETIAGFVAAAEAAPEELSTIGNVMTAPPMPFLPEETVGKPIIFGMLVHAGEAEAGERAVAPFRDLAEPLADMLKPMPYPDVYPPEEEYHPLASALTLFLDSVDRAAGEKILEFLKASTGMIAVAQLRVLGGAMARVPAGATAFAHRDARIMANVAALYEDPSEKPLHDAWVRDFAAALKPVDSAGYVNFLGDEGPDRVRAAYPGATWDRLREVKRRYDPDNLFRVNHNIPPAD